MSARIFFLALPVTLLVGCVSHVKVRETPCPCGEGFSCCPTLSLCLRAGETCPESYPASSEQGCENDADCPVGEVCAAWRLDLGHGDVSELSGPQECRRECADAFSCDTGEICAVSLHDGAVSTSLDLISMCLPDDPDTACAPWQCTGCSGLSVGQTECVGGDRMGCLVGVHPTCGVWCEYLVLGECAAGAIPPDPCEMFPCDDCLDAVGGEPFCFDDDLHTCAVPCPGKMPPVPRSVPRSR